MTHEEFEELLALAIEELLAARVPDLARLSGGDPRLAARLAEALAQSIRHLPTSAVSGPVGELGAYRLLAPLGSGGMGSVYLGAHRESGRFVALKVLPFPFSASRTQRERFHREAVALARLSHPAIVPMVEVGEHDGVPFLVMEYVEGRNLEERLQPLQRLDLATAREAGARLLPGEGPWERRVARLVRTVLGGVEALHGAGLVHRDLKPANLLLTAEGEPRLADFGLVLDEEDARLTAASAIVGTRNYLAPELTRPGARATPASDLWALGVTLYELLTFRAPFVASDPESLLRAIRERDPPAPASLNRAIPADLAAICMRALEKSPRRRYADSAAMASDLDAFAAGRPVARDRLAPLRRLVRATRWHRFRLAAALLLAVAATTSAILVARAAADAERAREERWLARFREGEVLLEADLLVFGVAKEERRARIEEALLRYRDCCELRPKRADAWLRIAEAQLVLDRPEEAEAALAAARQRGAEGWYAESLGARRRGEPVALDRFAEGGAATATRDWRALDRVALARQLSGARRHGEAIEILLDPRLQSEARLMADAQLAGLFHRELALGKTCFLSDSKAEARLALDYYDRALARCPDAEVVRGARAVLVRDLWSLGEHFGGEDDSLIEEALAEFERRARTSGSAKARGAHAACLWVAGRCEESGARFAAFGDDELAQLHLVDRITAVKALVCVHLLERAFVQLADPAFTPTWGPKLGPLGRLVMVADFVATMHPREAPAGSEVEAFVRAARERTSAVDYDEALQRAVAMARK